MSVKLHKYWFIFDRNSLKELDYCEYLFQFGITAFTYEDAVYLLKTHVFKNGMPEIVEYKEDVDIRDLDQGHIIPNMLPPNVRGIWYPQGLMPLIRE
ncbi:MAG TPA: hypothetical protein VEC36_07050 [Patescibacteria group bacterium]|nr:hypothetical protein [Patescibacteria group bacterium]